MANFDLIIKGGTIIDGHGVAGYRAEIGIRNGTIAAIGDLSAASGEVVDATGRMIAPGFIDMHTHSDLTPIVDGRCASKIRQGITTELVGNCGFSAFPLNAATGQAETEISRPIFMATDLQANWVDCAGYLATMEAARPAFNVATLVGNGTVRSAALGYDNRPPTGDELAAMRRHVAEALEQGAFGLSSGLTLYPSSVAQTDELVALSEEAARRGGIYVSHTRHLASWHFKSVQEAIEIGRRAGIPVEVAHLCIIDYRHWGQAEELLQIIETARCGGVDVTFDAYPYTAAGCPFNEMMPDWIQDGGSEAMLRRLGDRAVRNELLAQADTMWAAGVPIRWDKVVVAWCGPFGDAAWTGRSIQDLAEDAGISPPEMMLEVLTRGRDAGRLIVFNRLPEDVEQFVAHPLGMIGSDGIAVAADGRWGRIPVHPRYYGTFPRVLAHYVRHRGALPIEEAIRKMTSLSAQRLGLKDRGLLKEGYAADLVIFDAAGVQDRATFEQPHQYPEGISHVMVNGQWAVRDGVQTEARAGQVLRHAG